MDCPANGPGQVPVVVLTCSTTGSPAANGWFTPVICAAKYCAKRVSRNNRSPMESSAGVYSTSEGKFGASPAPQLSMNRNAVTQPQ